MKTTGVIFNLIRYAIHDGPGIRSTVFFKGCPLRCWWCHNPESQNLAPEAIEQVNHRSYLNSLRVDSDGMIGRKVSVDEIMNEIRKDIIFYDQSGGGVTFSGGEPLLQPRFLKSLLAACKEEGIRTAVDTSGYAPWKVFAEIRGLVDLFLYDLKIFNDAEHVKYTGVSNRLIHRNLVRLAENGNRIFLRIAIIPGVTDTGENLEQMAAFISKLKNVEKIHLLPYNPIGEGKYSKLGRECRLPHFKMQTNREMERFKEKFESTGFKIKMGG
jgi:pyruvate formate lyase activating enzyme